MLLSLHRLLLKSTLAVSDRFILALVFWSPFLVYFQSFKNLYVDSVHSSKVNLEQLQQQKKVLWEVIFVCFSQSNLYFVAETLGGGAAKLPPTQPPLRPQGFTVLSKENKDEC